MAEAGGSVFANMPLIFAIGVALGFTNNDGVSALAAVVAYGIMVKTMAVVAPLVLHLPAEEIASKRLADTGVLGGIISGAIAAYMLTVSTVLSCLSILASLPVNALCRSFLAWLPSLLALCCPSFGRRLVLQSRPSLSGLLYQNPVVAFGIYGFIERCLVPFGLHHIWNVPFQMQIGEYTNAAGQVFHGDIPRYMAGNPDCG